MIKQSLLLKVALMFVLIGLAMVCTTSCKRSEPSQSHLVTKIIVIDGTSIVITRASDSCEYMVNNGAYTTEVYPHYPLCDNPRHVYNWDMPEELPVVSTDANKPDTMIVYRDSMIHFIFFNAWNIIKETKSNGVVTNYSE